MRAGNREAVSGWRAATHAGGSGWLSTRFSLRLPDQGDGTQGAALRADRDGDRSQARAGFRRGDDGDASEPAGTLPQPHLHRARNLARPARRAVPGIVRSPLGSDGAMTLVQDSLVRQLGRPDYLPTFEAMRVFTAPSNEATACGVWLLEHPL